MPSVTASGGNGYQTPESISRSSSVTLVSPVSPVVRDGVGEVATKLVEIENVIEDLKAGLSSSIVRSPDVGDVLQEISKLQSDVDSTKLNQDAQIRGIRNQVKNDLKNEIYEMLEDEICAIITDSVAAQVEQEMVEWGRKFGVADLVSSLEEMMEKDNFLLEGAQLQFDNSWSRHANSTMDIHQDLNTALKPIKRNDGIVSEHFPTTLRDLFSYDATTLLWLLDEYNLLPLKKHNENLDRFLVFIGLNVSIPDQFLDFLEEQPPAYQVGGAVGLQGEEKILKPVGRPYSTTASKQSTNTYWYNLF